MFCFLGRIVLYLQSLEINGFKSFARSTRFLFTPGITALVGPNGSGKSNVVDAIRWCLGEQSVRDLRGQRAEDVIYAGTRHSLGAAEVLLTFATGTDEPWPAAEVTVGRRLYRSGDSEYLVDGRKVRLRDVMDTLRAVGIDGSRHIVVTQGMADALLSAAPAERRSLLEQAAGLTGYRVRRDEARQKLNTTRQNVSTIELVLAELEPRLRALRRQSRAVQDRDEAQSLLQRRLREWYAHRLATLRADEVEGSARAGAAASRRQEAEARLATLEHSADETYRESRAWQQKLDMLVAAHHGIERERDAAARLLTETEQRLVAAREQHESLTARLERMRAADEELRGRADASQEVLRALAADGERLKSQVEAAQLQFEQASAGLPDLDTPQRELLKEIAAREREERDQERRCDDLRRALAAARRRREVAGLELQEAESAIDASESAHTLARSELAHAASQADALTDRLASVEQTASARRARELRLDGLLVRTKSALQVVQRRGTEVQRSLQGIGLAAERSLVQQISVRDGWEGAVAAALGAWALADAEGAGPTLHPAGARNIHAWRAELERAAGVALWADAMVDGMPAELVNPLQTVALAERDEDACALWERLREQPALTVGTPAVVVATRAGVVWNALGREASGGDDRAATYLHMKRELESVSRREAELRLRTERISAAQLEAQNQRKNADDERSRLDAALRAARGRTSELEHTVARRSRELAELRPKCDRLRGELAELERSGSSLTGELESTGNLVSGVRRTVTELRDRLRVLREQSEQMQRRVAALDQQRRDARGSYELALSRRDAHQEICSAAASELARLGRELEAGEKEEIELAAAITRLESELRSRRQSLEPLDALLVEHGEKLAAIRRGQPDPAAPTGKLREGRVRVAETVRVHESALAAAQNLQERVAAVEQELRGELGLEASALPAPAEDPPSDAEIKRLRQRAMQYADADVSVVAEARELGERHAYLQEHLEDLRKAAQKLEEMMELADLEMRTQFDAAFGAVSAEFSRVFEVMLRGGRARLEQTEGGGVEVVAQLPGKRLRTSAAFSGGERSLIASSLLFGVLRMRPAPFCVLDEVDAALDEGNVDRYLSALRDISTRTQALVVTHNRATMAAADVLYGLTMDAEGASNVLSLRLDNQVAG